MLNVAYMKLVDRVLLDHLKQNAVNREVHVVYREVAGTLQISQPTVYRSMVRLRNEGHLQLTAGNDRIGYTYQINE